MRESEAEEKEAGELKAFRQKFIASGPFFFVQSLTEAYILLRSREITKKKNQNQKLLQGIKWEETKNCNKKAKGAGSQQCRMNKQCCRMNSVVQRQFRNRTKFLLCSIFFVFSTLLSFWSLIYNAKFDSNSLCLYRLNNFGINSLQKLQN